MSVVVARQNQATRWGAPRAEPLARRSQRGIGYWSVVAVLMVAAMSAQTASLLQTRLRTVEMEQELLFRGAAYQRAIESFNKAPGVARRYPRSLDELLEDPRKAGVRRHLRALYPEPVEKKGWTLIRGSHGGIVGVASPSKQSPSKVSGFPPGFESFEKAKRYSDWKFLAR